MAAEPRGVERVEARVDLVDRAFVVRRVLLLDDALHAARARLRITRPRPAGSIGVDDGDRDRRVVEAALGEEIVEQVRTQQRHVAVEDEDLLDVVGNVLEGRAQGGAGAVRLGCSA